MVPGCERFGLGNGTRTLTDITVVDTDILIDAGRGIDEAVEYLGTRERRTVLAVSVVTKMELIVGCRNKEELRHVDRMLGRFRSLTINEVISDKAAGLLRQYRLSHGLLIADAFVAATAVCWNCSLASKNQRDYRFIKGLDLLPYP